MEPRIAVTGLGLVTPIGAGLREVWEGFLAGRSGFAPVESFDTQAFTTHLGAEVRGFDPAPWVRRQDAAALGRASQLAIAAARMALEDAGLDPEDVVIRAGRNRHGHHLRRAAGGGAFRRPLPRRRARPGGAGIHLALSLPHDRRPRGAGAGLRRPQHDDPHRLRGRQLRHRPRGRHAARRPRRRHAGRRRRRLLAHHLHRLPPPGRHRARALPAVRPATARG